MKARRGHHKRNCNPAQAADSRSLGKVGQPGVLLRHLQSGLQIQCQPSVSSGGQNSCRYLSHCRPGMVTGLRVTCSYLPFVTKEIGLASLTCWRCFATVTPSSLPITCGRAKYWIRCKLAETVIWALSVPGPSPAPKAA